MVTAVLIGHRQVGNGGAAVKAGNHASQKGGGGGGGGGGGAAPVAPDGVEVSDQVSPSGTTRFRDYDFSVGGDDITVRFTTNQSGSTEVEFQVNGSLNAGGGGKNNREIQNKISSVFRADIASRPNGFKYNTSAWSQDGRGGFREAMYARAGFSLGGGVESKVGGGQYGVIRNGRLIPSTSTGKPFTAAQQKAHAAATRKALVEGLRQAKASR